MHQRRKSSPWTNSWLPGCGTPMTGAKELAQRVPAMASIGAGAPKRSQAILPRVWPRASPDSASLFFTAVVRTPRQRTAVGRSSIRCSKALDRAAALRSASSRLNAVRAFPRVPSGGKKFEPWSKSARRVVRFHTSAPSAAFIGLKYSSTAGPPGPTPCSASRSRSVFSRRSVMTINPFGRLGRCKKTAIFTPVNTHSQRVLEVHSVFSCWISSYSCPQRWTLNP